jgi:hypothetical protein
LKLGKVFTPTVFTNMLIVIGCVVYQLWAFFRQS